MEEGLDVELVKEVKRDVPKNTVEFIGWSNYEDHDIALQGWNDAEYDVGQLPPLNPARPFGFQWSPEFAPKPEPGTLSIALKRIAILTSRISDDVTNERIFFRILDSNN